MKFLSSDGAGAVARLAATIWAGYVAAAVLGYYFGLWRFQRHHVESAWLLLAVLASIALWLRRPAAWPPSHENREAQRIDGRSWLLALAGGVATSFAFYGGALGLGLFSDDFVLLSRARDGAYAAESAEFFRPAPLWLWSGVVRLTSDASPWLHAINIVLHGVNGALAWRLARRWGLQGVWPIVAALLFLTFPASVEAVAWPSGIQDVLMTTAGLLVVCLLNGDRPGVVTLPAVMLLLLVALLTKETAVAIVGLAGLVFVSRRLRAGASGIPVSTHDAGRTFAAAVVVSGVYAAWRLSTLAGPVSNVPGASRLAIKDFVVRPFAALGSPWSTADLAAWPIAGVLSGCLIAGLIVAAVWRSRASPADPVVTPLVWVLIAAAPVGRYFFVGPDLDGSRYLYLPSVAWAIWLATLGQTAAGPRGGRTSLHAVLAGAALSLLAIAQVAGTFAHIGAWRTAAGERDRLLDAVTAVAQREACSAVAIEPVPDAIGGVYVFRNGLAEALREQGISAGLAARADVPERCRIAWPSLRP